MGSTFDISWFVGTSVSQACAAGCAASRAIRGAGCRTKQDRQARRKSFGHLFDLGYADIAGGEGLGHLQSDVAVADDECDGGAGERASVPRYWMQARDPSRWSREDRRRNATCSLQPPPQPVRQLEPTVTCLLSLSERRGGHSGCRISGAPDDRGVGAAASHEPPGRLGCGAENGRFP